MYIIDMIYVSESMYLCTSMFYYVYIYIHNVLLYCQYILNIYIPYACLKEPLTHLDPADSVGSQKVLIN